MPLDAFRVKSGRAYDIYILSQDDRSDMVEFIEELQEQRPHDWRRIQRYFDYTKNNGLIKTPDQFKQIGEGFWEFRTWEGARIFCFLDGLKMMLCTNGYIKKKDDISDGEWVKMRKWKARYQSAKQSKTLRFIDDLI